MGFPVRRWWLRSWFAIGALLGGNGIALAQAPTDINNINFAFKPVPGADVGNLPQATCNIPGFEPVSCATAYRFSGDTTTSFIQETIDIGGLKYYHVVVGQPEQGFATEYFMRIGGEVLYGNPLSDSGGAVCFPGPFMSDAAAELCARNNNARYPLDPDWQISGNGTGNPTAIVMRQVLADPANGFQQEFLKNRIDRKPIIKQQIDASSIKSDLTIDMSEIDYQTDSTAGKVTNRLKIQDPSGTTLADFDSAVNANPDGVTAGRYTYGPSDVQPSYQGKVYTYFNGTIDPVLTTDWAAFKDPAQNP